MDEFALGELCWLWNHADDLMPGSSLAEKIRALIQSKTARELTDEEIRELARSWRAENQ